MSAVPPYENSPMRAEDQPSVIARKWASLHADAAQLARLADLAPETEKTEISTFAMQLEDAQPWQRRLAMEAINDIDAMMQPGLSALRTISARGQDATAPALALWREFHVARQAVIEMVAQSPASEAQDAA